MTDIDWTRLPPLTALRAFEATARLESFSAAARSLNVTHAAVAQQVRALEDHLQLALVRRDSRGMTATPEGARLAAALGEAFRKIQEGVDEVRATEDAAPLKISLTPAFAENWLMPRLGSFWAAHPEIELALIPSTALADLRAGGYDMAIRYGSGAWPGLEAELLTSTRFVVVGTPELTGDPRPGSFAELTRFTWLTAQDSPEQALWAESTGLSWTRVRATSFPTTGLSLAATRAGYGLSIQPITLVEDDLRAGRLAALFEQESLGLGYHIVTRPGHRPPRLRAFIGWLRQAAGPQAGI
ncbi:LysR family transcriptional regulator [Rhodovulum sulfidophilum]|uniref:LysR family transcriptional regulator n=1 Tax=Rhodovulum sulfidophilum TaxID=35806 RepID=UPI001925F25D|nr:LysR family transcriptional regulator [Rhodovulum sulfidophilum]MBL3585764.1 LysR family transcriptional regulator [Rhodovulum sulfidophilum]